MWNSLEVHWSGYWASGQMMRLVRLLLIDNCDLVHRQTFRQTFWDDCAFTLVWQRVHSHCSTQMEEEGLGSWGISMLETWLLRALQLPVRFPCKQMFMHFVSPLCCKRIHYAMAVGVLPWDTGSPLLSIWREAQSIRVGQSSISDLTISKVWRRPIVNDCFLYAIDQRPSPSQLMILVSQPISLCLTWMLSWYCPLSDGTKIIG